MKKIFLLAILGLITFVSCKKDNFERFTPSSGGFEAKEVTASFSGVIVSSDETGLKDVAVQIGNHTTTTDENGVFFFKDIAVPNSKAYFVASKAGYFHGSRTIFAQANQTHQVRIKMLNNSPIGSFQNNNGGTVTLPEGGQLTFEPGDVAYPNGDSFAGQVFVAAKRIDPTTANGKFEMPGDLRAKDKDDKDMTLSSYGMMAVELTDASGNLLQVAENQTVDITFEVPSSIVATAPADIPLWYFDETNGVWKEEGSATLSGNTYQGQVGHFSFWNCDANFPRVYFEARFVDENGQAIVGAWISIELPDGNRRVAMTNSNGWVGGEVMANATMKLFFQASAECGFSSQYITDFTTTNLDINLGDVSVTVNAPVTYTLTGTLVDCSDNPVSNGYIGLHSNTWYFESNVFVNSDGTFALEYTTCENLDSVYLTGYDYDNLEQSALLGYDLTLGTDLGNIKACGTALDEYITFNYTASSGIDTIHTILPPNLSFQDSLQNWSIGGYDNNNGAFYLQSPTLSIGNYSGTGYYETLSGYQSFYCDFMITSYPTTSGEYIEGSFTSNNVTPIVTGSFKVKRQ